jgi:hypothetical protein
MRTPALVPLLLLTAACLAPGERDPTRYPWDRRSLALAPHPPVVARGAIPPLASPLPPSVPPKGTYCVIALEPQKTTGITVGGKAGMMACSAPASAAPPPAPHD